MLIGLSGKKGSGKSASAEYLVKQHGFVEVSFADALKKICLAIGAPRWSVYGSQRDKSTVIRHLGVSGRELMQVVGTELFRMTLPKLLPNFKPKDDLWVTIAEHKIQQLFGSRGASRVVVSDVRFDNEAEMVARNGGTVILIQRGANERRTVVDNHPSEQGISHYDILLENSSDLEDLYSILDSVVKKLEFKTK